MNNDNSKMVGSLQKSAIHNGAMNMHQRIKICANMAGSGHSLSKKTGIPRRTLETYLSGKAEPKASKLEAIAKASGVTIDWIVAGREPKYRQDTDHPKGDVNMELLKRVIEVVEHAISVTAQSLSLETKANLISIVYDIHNKPNSKIVPEHIIRLLRLAK